MIIESIVDLLRADPACSISHERSKTPLPTILPDDVCRFFSQTWGGSLFYHPDHPTPQFGCNLDLGSDSVARAMGGSDGACCEGPEFDHLYPVADFLDAGDYSVATVSTMPNDFGSIYSLHYGLGDPTLCWSDVFYLAPSFSRWLLIHIEAWEVYQNDWREGLKHFRNLIAQERRVIGLPS